MKIVTEQHYRFKQPDKDGSTRCSIIHKGKYIFSAKEANKLRPDLVEEYHHKKIYYTDDEDFQKAIKEMPDYKCWDSEKKVLIK